MAILSTEGLIMEQVAERVYGGVANTTVLAQVPKVLRTVLDVGCGAGGNAAALVADGKIVDGITLSPEEARLASPWCRAVLMHDLELGIPESLHGPYDLCLCSHVIEHIRNPTPLLHGIRRVLAPRGLLLVALPNLLQYRYRWALCRGRLEYESGGILDSTHVRWYTWDSGKQLLESHGFSVEKRIADGNFPLSKLRKILPGFLVRPLDQSAVRRFPGLFGHQHLFLARPA